MPNIHHEVLIGASAEKVYNAITTQEGLSGWWTKAKVERESTAEFTFGHGYVKKMKITELIPLRSVRWTCIEGLEEWLHTTLSFAIESYTKTEIVRSREEIQDQVEQQKILGELTILTLHHDGWAAYTPMFAECSYTWGRFLGSLKSLCETGTGHPWPTQHRADA